MKRLKEMLRAMFYRYCIVFTLVMGINLLIPCMTGHINESFEIKNLLVIELIAVLCALGEIFFFVKTELTKGEELFCYILHYIYINVVVITLVFTYSKINIPLFLLVIASIAVIYWINFVIDFYQNKKDASKINDLLQKINKNDE